MLEQIRLERLVLMSSLTRLFFRAVILALVVGIVIALGLLGKLAITGTKPTVPRTYAERAYMDAEEAVKANPESPKARVALAKAYIAVGRYGDAIEQASIATRLDRSSTDAYMTLGIAENKTGRYGDAIAALEKAVNLKTGTAELYSQAWFALGQAYESGGNLAKAVNAYKNAYYQSSQDVEVGYAYAKALEKVGQIQNAIYVYQDIIAFIPNEQKAKDELVRLNAVLEAAKKKSAQGTAPTTAAAPKK